MLESDGEIEYLDEDAEIVQQCVQVPTEETNLLQPIQKSINVQKSAPLLVERRVERGRKRRKRRDEDSDYDPNEDVMMTSPPASPKSKRKKFPSRQYKLPIDQEETKSVRKVKQKAVVFREPELIRKKCNIRIPDYDDPLCLPVKALKNQESDVRRLENWNNVCLEHFKHCDSIMKSERGDTKSSARILVLKNLMNKQTGKVETTIWSKTSVENMDGDKKSEIFQCVLPRYKEKRALTNFVLASRRVRPYRLVDEAILSREDHKNGEALVVYKPREATSAVYKLFDKKGTSMEQELLHEDQKSFLREMACCKVCVRCFQTSWRGAEKTDSKKTILCPICGRTYVTVHNLLAHFKSHSAADVKKCKRLISTALSDLVGYHYKCRVCQLKTASIKALRQHLNIHKGTESFLCEVGNHAAL